LDRDLEGARSLGAVLTDGNFVCRKKYGPNIGLLLGSRLQETAALQANLVFPGGMASAFAKASPFAEGFGGQVGGHARAVPIFSLF